MVYARYWYQSETTNNNFIQIIRCILIHLICSCAHALSFFRKKTFSSFFGNVLLFFLIFHCFSCFFMLFMVLHCFSSFFKVSWFFIVLHSISQFCMLLYFIYNFLEFFWISSDFYSEKRFLNFFGKLFRNFVL